MEGLFVWSCGRGGAGAVSTEGVETSSPCGADGGVHAAGWIVAYSPMKM
jgi:hypothetical protein